MLRRAILIAASIAALSGCASTVRGGEPAGGQVAGAPDAGPPDPGSTGGGPDAAVIVPIDAGAPGEEALPLQETLDRLHAEAAWRTPGTQPALAVADLETGARAQVGGDDLFVSASSAKAWWVAAALHGVGIDPVSPYADPIFVSSDNAATGAVIDLIGPDAVNPYLWDVVGMSSTAFTRWNYGGTREATNSPRLMGTNNYTTARDAVSFLLRLDRKEILDEPRTAALLDWMKRSPRTGYGGWMLTRLPDEVRATASHKAGWLPPGCCSDDAYFNTLNDVGIVTAPGGKRYAVAILTHGGEDYWGRQAPFLEYASCEIYRVFASDVSLDCSRPSDPRRP